MSGLADRDIKIIIILCVQKIKEDIKRPKSDF